MPHCRRPVGGRPCVPRPSSRHGCRPRPDRAGASTDHTNHRPDGRRGTGRDGPSDPNGPGRWAGGRLDVAGRVDTPPAAPGGPSDGGVGRTPAGPPGGTSPRTVATGRLLVRATEGSLSSTPVHSRPGASWNTVFCSGTKAPNLCHWPTLDSLTSLCSCVSLSSPFLLDTHVGSAQVWLSWAVGRPRTVGLGRDPSTYATPPSSPS